MKIRIGCATRKHDFLQCLHCDFAYMGERGQMLCKQLKDSDGAEDRFIYHFAPFNVGDIHSCQR